MIGKLFQSLVARTVKKVDLTLDVAIVTPIVVDKVAVVNKY